MNTDWMNPDAPNASPAQAAKPTAKTNASHKQASHPRSLRALDIGLAGFASAGLLALFPLPLAAALRGELQGNRRLGAQHRGFTQLSWRFPDTFGGRLLTRLGARGWPRLLNILRGDMAWVGPRARQLHEPAGPAAHLRPGVTGLHQLRQATAVDFMSEDTSEAAYAETRSLSHDARLLLLAAWARLGGRKAASTASAPPDQVQILDVCVDNLSMDGAVQRVADLIAAGHPAQVSFVNPACANIAARHSDYRRDLAACDLVLPDGIGMKIAAQWLGTPIRQNVNGTDFFPRLCNTLNKQGQRLYLVGARPEVVVRVAEVVRERWPGIQVVGAQHGYFGPAEEASIAQDIQESGAHVVLVAMGVPMQESFIARNSHRMGPSVAIGVGGLFDFVAGRISRAPQWMRDAGLEWVWRLIQEPGRMWQRYLVGNASFLARVALQRRGWRACQAAPAPQAAPLPTGASAILLATHAISPEPGAAPLLAASLPFGPASFAEMAVAQLANHAVTEIHVLTSAEGPSTEALQAQLGDGSRWGVRIHWHQSAQDGEPHQPLRAVAEALPVGASPLLIQAHTWLQASAMERIAREPQIALSISAQGIVSWQGWACVSRDDLNAISRGHTTEAFENILIERLPTRYIAMANESAGAHDRAAWISAQTSVPAATLVALQTDVWTAHPWGYASAHAHVSPDAHIEGPVWIGPGCTVRADAHLGPHVTLSRDVVVEPHAMLSCAVGLPDAYIGSHTSNTPTQANASAPPSASSQPHHSAVNDSNDATLIPVPRSTRWLAAMLAAALAPLVMPWLGVRKILRRGSAWSNERVVLGRPQAGARLLTTTLRQPVAGNANAARWLAWYGALLDVAQGRRHWVGVRARRMEQWFALETDARAALSMAPIGLWQSVAWTNRFDCVLHAEAAADRLWLARRPSPHTAGAWNAVAGLLRQRLSTGPMAYRALAVI
jgi:N-acetylglucosaminyldiphosphoundecaprenol N-acetyl-beta-D-mannosaminyltransferase